MFFAPLIEKWGPAELATDLGLPTKNVRRWIDNDSIPAEWFAAIARCAADKKLKGIDERTLAALAEARRIGRSSNSEQHSAAA